MPGGLLGLLGGSVDTLIEALINAFSNFLLAQLQAVLNALMSWVNFLLTSTQNFISNSAYIGTPTTGLMGTWIHLRNISLSLLIVPLVIIAVTNIVGFGKKNYQITKLVPNIILAIILSTFSFVICKFFFEVSAALSSLLANSGFSTLATGTPDLTQVTHVINNASGSIGTALGGPGVLGPGATAGAVGALIKLLFYFPLYIMILFDFVLLSALIMMRLVALYILVALAPIAFLAMVLPFTESYMSKWWSEFWRWLFMGPVLLLYLFLANDFIKAATSMGSGWAGTWGDLFNLIAAAIILGLAPGAAILTTNSFAKKTKDWMTKQGKNALKTAADTYTPLPAAKEALSNLQAGQKSRAEQNKYKFLKRFGNVAPDALKNQMPMYQGSKWQERMDLAEAAAWGKTHSTEGLSADQIMGMTRGQEKNTQAMLYLAQSLAKAKDLDTGNKDQMRLLAQHYKYVSPLLAANNEGFFPDLYSKHPDLFSQYITDKAGYTSSADGKIKGTEFNKIGGSHVDYMSARQGENSELFEKYLDRLNRDMTKWQSGATQKTQDAVIKSLTEAQKTSSQQIAKKIGEALSAYHGTSAPANPNNPDSYSGA